MPALALLMPPKAVGRKPGRMVKRGRGNSNPGGRSRRPRKLPTPRGKNNPPIKPGEPTPQTDPGLTPAPLLSPFQLIGALAVVAVSQLWGFINGARGPSDGRPDDINSVAGGTVSKTGRSTVYWGPGSMISYSAYGNPPCQAMVFQSGGTAFAVSGITGAYVRGREKGDCAPTRMNDLVVTLRGGGTSVIATNGGGAGTRLSYALSVRHLDGNPEPAVDPWAGEADPLIRPKVPLKVPPALVLPQPKPLPVLPELVPEVMPELEPVPEIPTTPVAPPLPVTPTPPLPDAWPVPGRVRPGSTPLPGPSKQPSPTVRPDLAPAPLPPGEEVLDQQVDGLLVPTKPVRKPETTPPGAELTPDGIIGGPGKAPQPNLPEIAAEVGRLEQKMLLLLNRPAPGGDGSDLMQLLLELMDMLQGTYGPGEYELAPVCEFDSNGKPRKPDKTEWSGGIGLLSLISEKQDALAELLQFHKNQLQPTCPIRKGKPLGKGVTVRFEQIVDHDDPQTRT